MNAEPKAGERAPLSGTLHRQPTGLHRFGKRRMIALHLIRVGHREIGDRDIEAFTLSQIARDLTKIPGPGMGCARRATLRHAGKHPNNIAPRPRLS